MKTLAYWLLVIALIAATRGAAFLEPDPCDAYTYAYVGAKWADGRQLYRDLWENKPPAIYLVDGGAFLLDRAHLWRSLYVVESGTAILTALCLCGILRRWVGRPCDRVVTAVAVVLAFSMRFAYSGNLTEGYQVACVVAGLWVFTARGWSGSPAWLLAVGSLIGLGGLFKPPGLAAGLAIVLWLGAESLGRRLSWRHFFLKTGALVCGLTLPWLILTGWFAGHRLAGEMLYASLGYNRQYGQDVWRSRGLVWAILSCYQELWVALPVLATAACGAMALLDPRRWFGGGKGGEPNWRLLAVLWMLGDLAGALAGGRCYQHYFVPLVVSASAVSAFVLNDVRQRLVGATEGAAAGRIALCVLGMWLATIVGRDVVWGASLARSGWESPETRGRRELAQMVRQTARPGDTLFTWGSAAYFFYETWLDPIYPDKDTHRALDFDAKAAQVGRDVLAALQQRPPRFIITDVNEDHPQRPQPDIVRAFEYYKMMVESDYRRVAQRGPRSLWVRKADARPTTTTSTRPTTTTTGRSG